MIPSMDVLGTGVLHENYPKCGNPVDGQYCQGCALPRKKFKEDLFTYCIENGILQGLLDTFEPSNDNTNIVNAPQEPFVVKQDLENSSTYESKSNIVDDSPKDFDPPPQPPFYSCEFCRNDARYGHYCTPQEEEKRIEEEQAAKVQYWRIPFCYDDDDDNEDYTIVITPILSTKELDNSLNYEAFYDNHVKEISSGSTTTHSNFSLYDLFIFDLSINPFPLIGRSDFYKFADELAHIISLPEYDCFCLKNEPNSGDFTMDVVEDTSLTREPRFHIFLEFRRLMLKDFVLQSSFP
nr:hypothetical protein [Tanacetum cinerariifolium]